MSESFPFGAVQDAPVLEVETNGGDSRRRLLLVGGLLAAALTAGSLLLLGGDDTVVVVPPTASAPRVAAAATPSAAPVVLPAPFDEALGRDPFRALYVEPAGSQDAVAAGSAADPTVLSAAPAPAAPPAAAPVPDVPLAVGVPAAAPAGPLPVGAPVAAPAGPTSQEHALVLKRVYGSGPDLTAEFTIDGRKALAKVGVRFGPIDEIRLISLQQGPAASQWTAVLQVGDGEPFDAVTGDEISVR